MKKQCLSCRLYKMVDATSGKCRADGLKPQDRPSVDAVNFCEKWEDAGQQYYIRLGWIKGQKNKEDQLH